MDTGFLGIAVSRNVHPEGLLPGDRNAASPHPGERAAASECLKEPRDGAGPIELTAGEQDRPIPLLRSRRGLPLAILLAGSLALHAAVLLTLMREPEPLPSIGIPAISVEIVLGAHAPAGTDSAATGDAPAESAADPERHRLAESLPETQAAEDAEQVAAPPEPTRQALEVVADPEVPAATAAAPAQPVETAEQVSDPAPLDNPERRAGLVPEPDPQTVPAQRVERPPGPAPQEPPEQPAKRAAKSETEKRRPTKPAKTASRSSAAGGIGVGRSAADATYPGRVAAHLARYKRFPSDADGERGSALVSFRVTGSGQVTSVQLVRGTGVAALDREAQAMIRRASPVPAPPTGQPTSFTLPVSFQQR